MSKVGKREKKEEKEKKIGNPISVMFKEETIVEDPEDIIEQDPDVERKNAFKKAYEIILSLVPEAIEKKKKKKSKEKEEFDKNLAFRDMSKNREVKEKEQEIKIEDKGRGRE